MRFEEFKQEILDKTPDSLLRDWLFSRRPHVFPSDDKHKDFVSAVKREFKSSEEVVVAGTANWVYSLNPKKGFSQFGNRSDIDTVIIDPQNFNSCWDEIRKKDRLTAYIRSSEESSSYRSAANNIYSGFVAPVWILDFSHKMRFDFRRKLNSVSNSVVGGRDVKALFFKSRDEVLDYYRRGVMLAKAKLK